MSELSHLPWLIGGDFNKILLDNEKQGGRPRSLQQMRAFQDTLTMCGVQDLSYLGEKFTWVNKHDDVTFIQEILDRFVGDLAWNRLFPNA